MRVQQNISEEVTAEKVGKAFRVIIDRVEGDYYIGRTQYDSPEVDPEVLIRTDEGELAIGAFYNVKIAGADAFDLYGSVVP
jgi:ribosomal protein S12 methylthiotransferase